MKDETSADHAAHEPDLNLLAAHFEGALSSRESADLAAHLAACRACRTTAALMSRAFPRDSVRRPGTPVVGWLALAATLVLATIVGIRIAREPSLRVPAPEPGPVPTAPAENPSPPAAASAAPAAPAVEPRDVKRGGDRRVAGKAFRLVAGEWVDRSFDPTSALPIVEVPDPQSRDAVLAEQPNLAPYVGLGDRVLVVFHGTVYRFGPVRR